MQFKLIAITRQIACLLLIAAILLPSIKRLNHALYEHSHVVCENENTLHVHQTEVDCEFQKFYPSPSFVQNNAVCQLFYEHNFDLGESPFQDIFSTSSITYFSLRGPPLVA